jgi:hypothetical protein
VPSTAGATTVTRRHAAARDLTPVGGNRFDISIGEPYPCRPDGGRGHGLALAEIFADRSTRFRHDAVRSGAALVISCSGARVRAVRDEHPLRRRSMRPRISTT